MTASGWITVQLDQADLGKNAKFQVAAEAKAMFQVL